MSVLGLMNDHEHHVQLLVDKDLLEDDYLGCHPCINTRSLKIKMKESKEIIKPALHHEPIFEEVDDE